MVDLISTPSDTATLSDQNRAAAVDAIGIDTLFTTDAGQVPGHVVDGIDTLFVTDAGQVPSLLVNGIEQMYLTDSVLVERFDPPGSSITIQDSVLIFDTDRPESIEPILFDQVFDTVTVEDLVDVDVKLGVIIIDTMVIADAGIGTKDNHTLDDTAGVADSLAGSSVKSIVIVDDVDLEEQILLVGARKDYSQVVRSNVAVTELVTTMVGNTRLVAPDEMRISDDISFVVEVSFEMRDVTVAVEPTRLHTGVSVAPTVIREEPESGIVIGSNAINAYIAPTIHERTR